MQTGVLMNVECVNANSVFEVEGKGIQRGSLGCAGYMSLSN